LNVQVNLFLGNFKIIILHFGQVYNQPFPLSHNAQALGKVIFSRSVTALAPAQRVT
jgi:hypothetical protein